MSKVYRDERGVHLLYGWQETRDGVEGTVLLGVKGRKAYTRFYASNTVIPAEMVLDTDSRAEAAVERAYASQVEVERDALLDVLKEASRHLAPSMVDELRAMYLKRIK